MFNPITEISLLFKNFWMHRHLIWQLSKREIVGRYRGSFMGVFWSFFNPLLLLAVYTFVFSVVFQARFSSANMLHEGKMTYALIIFSGITVFGLLSECLNRAPTLIISHVNFVKKVIFPLEILPCTLLLSAFFHMLISLGILLVFNTLINGMFPWTIVFLPLILLPFFLLVLAFTFFISATGVFLRDLGQFMGLLITVVLFLSPVFYSRSSLPVSLQPWLLMNPITFIVEQVQNILFYQKMLDGVGLMIYYLVSIFIFCLSILWFQKTRKAFGDML